jgi:hypothetical protein
VRDFCCSSSLPNALGKHLNFSTTAGNFFQILEGIVHHLCALHTWAAHTNFGVGVLALCASYLLRPIGVYVAVAPLSFFVRFSSWLRPSPLLLASHGTIFYTDLTFWRSFLFFECCCVVRKNFSFLGSRRFIMRFFSVDQ